MSRDHPLMLHDERLGGAFPAGAATGEADGLVQSVRGGLARRRAYRLVRQAILDGEFPAGCLLGEEWLARRLEMSRTPVREALQALVQEGLLEVGRRRRLCVRRLSPELVREVFLVRTALESLAVVEAAGSLDTDALDRLQLVLVKQRRECDAGHAKRFIELDEQFHLHIAAAARLPTAEKFLTELRAFVRMMGIDALSRPGRMARVLAEHREILEAIEAHDAEQARRAMAAHLRATEEVLRGVYAGKGVE